MMPEEKERVGEERNKKPCPIWHVYLGRFERLSLEARNASYCVPDSFLFPLPLLSLYAHSYASRLTFYLREKGAHKRVQLLGLRLGSLQ